MSHEPHVSTFFWPYGHLFLQGLAFEANDGAVCALEKVPVYLVFLKDFGSLQASIGVWDTVPFASHW